MLMTAPPRRPGRQENEVCPAKLSFPIEIAFDLTLFEGPPSRALNIYELKGPSVLAWREEAHSSKISLHFVRRVAPRVSSRQPKEG